MHDYTTFPQYRHVHDINTNGYPTIFRQTRHLSVVYISTSLTRKSLHTLISNLKKNVKTYLWAQVMFKQRSFISNMPFLSLPQYQCNLFICHNNQFLKISFLLEKASAWPIMWQTKVTWLLFGIHSFRNKSMGSLNCLKKEKSWRWDRRLWSSGWNNGSICHFSSHWMHLKTCTEVRVLRRGSKSRCSHCMCTLKLSRSGPYMRLVKSVNCYFIKMCYLIIYCYLKLIWFFLLYVLSILSPHWTLNNKIAKYQTFCPNGCS